MSLVNIRIQHKHDLEVAWRNSTFVPMAGEIIVYDAEISGDGTILDHPQDRDPITSARFKIGDGHSIPSQLPFASILDDDIAYVTEDDDTVNVDPVLIIDTELSQYSENAVQNKVITEALRQEHSYAEAANNKIEELTKSFESGEISVVSSWDTMTDKPFYDDSTTTTYYTSDAGVSFEEVNTGYTFTKISSDMPVLDNLMGAEFIAVHNDGKITENTIDSIHIIAQSDDLLILQIGEIMLVTAYKSGECPINAMGMDIIVNVPESGVYILQGHCSILSNIQLVYGEIKQIDEKYLSILEEVQNTSATPSVALYARRQGPTYKIKSEYLPEGSGESIFKKTTGRKYYLPYMHFMSMDNGDVRGIPLTTTKEMFDEWNSNIGSTVFVYYDGIEYECNITSLIDAVFVGDSSRWGGPSADYPFFITVLNDAYPDGSRYYYFWVVCLEDSAKTPHSVMISYTSDIYEMKEDYKSQLYNKDKNIIIPEETIDFPKLSEGSSSSYFSSCVDQTIYKLTPQSYIVIFNGERFETDFINGDFMKGIEIEGRVSIAPQSGGELLVITPASEELRSLDIYDTNNNLLIKSSIEDYTTIMVPSDAEDDNGGYFYALSKYSGVEIPTQEQVIVTWDGVDYECTATILEGYRQYCLKDPHDSVFNIQFGHVDLNNRGISYLYSRNQDPHTFGIRKHEIPTFELSKLGVPTIIPTGDTVLTTTDAREVFEAAKRGPVRFIGRFNMGGDEIDIAVVCNPATIVGDTGFNFTNISNFQGTLIASSIDVGESFIQISSRPLNI